MNAARSLEALPVPVTRAIRKLGQDISAARRRRRFTQASLAERIGASLATLRRLEGGDPRIPLHFVARTLLVFGELDRLEQLLDASLDDIGLTLAGEQLPQRVRVKRAARKMAAGPGGEPPGAL